MIISHTHKYVYIGIPRTGSKSMNHWLCEHFDGKWHGGHHDYTVPKEAADYLIFTIVRNPYDRAVSGTFGVAWDDQGPKPHEIGTCHTEQQRLQRSRAVLATRPKQPKPTPPPSTDPLEQRIRDVMAYMNQKRFVDLAGVKLVLYFERLPQCLAELPFVDPHNVPPFPHHPERGIRPAGNFFDFFRSPDDEKVVWACDAEVFEAFGYRRYDCGLPSDAPSALWMR